KREIIGANFLRGNHGHLRLTRETIRAKEIVKAVLGALGKVVVVLVRRPREGRILSRFLATSKRLRPDTRSDENVNVTILVRLLVPFGVGQERNGVTLGLL